MKSAKEIFDLRFFVRLGCIVIIIALAIFLYFFGKQRTLLVDNWSIEINGTNYQEEDWARVEIDDLGTQEYYPRMRIGIPLRGRSHTITITYDDMSFTEYDMEPIEFSLDYDTSIISLPALIAGLPAEECIQEFIPEPALEPTAEENPEEAIAEQDAGFGDMTMEI